MLLGIVLTRSDWVSPPSSGGGGDTINNYYNNTYYNQFNQNLNTTSNVSFSNITTDKVIYTTPDFFYLNRTSLFSALLDPTNRTYVKAQTGINFQVPSGTDSLKMENKLVDASMSSIRTNITSCTEALETDSIGRIQCGTDATGSASGDNAGYQPSQLIDWIVITSDATSFQGLINKKARNLNFTVLTGNYYQFKFAILWQSNDTTNGAKFGLETPAFTFYNAKIRVYGQAAAGTDSVFEGNIRTSNATVSSTASIVVATTYLAEIEGVILPTANGDISVIYSSELATCNTTIKQGSMAWLYNYTKTVGAPGK